MISREVRLEKAHPEGRQVLFYIEAIPKNVVPKLRLNSPWSFVAAGAKTEPPLGSDPVYDPTSARRPIGAIGAPRMTTRPSAEEAFLAEQRRLQAQAQAERELLLQREREEAERRRVAQAQSEEASLALARRLMAEDAAAARPARRARVPVRFKPAEAALVKAGGGLFI